METSSTGGCTRITGLGLFISKSLMEKMNGEIYAEVHENLLHIFCKWSLK
ncbi:two component sensor kinase [Clostridium botulinum A3 str. Loch Maree]|nr:two component sensor kinase [Clostridium botulinum A3 str. Loch Maree]